MTAVKLSALLWLLRLLYLAKVTCAAVYVLSGGETCGGLLSGELGRGGGEDGGVPPPQQPPEWKFSIDSEGFCLVARGGGI